MKKSVTFLLGTLMVAGVLAGATTSTATTKKGNTIQPVLRGGVPAPFCQGCSGQGGGNNGGK